MKKNPQYVHPNNAMGFISDDGSGDRYNLCHCAYILFLPLDHLLESDFLYHTVWSNFEIANMKFWRGEAYMSFFEYLDSQGGFYYEVWLIL